MTGAFGYRDLPLDQWLYGMLNPYNVISDVLGLAVLVVFAWYYGLLQWKRFKSFLMTGKLEKRLV